MTKLKNSVPRYSFPRIYRFFIELPAKPILSAFDMKNAVKIGGGAYTATIHDFLAYGLLEKYCAHSYKYTHIGAAIKTNEPNLERFKKAVYFPPLFQKLHEQPDLNTASKVKEFLKSKNPSMSDFKAAVAAGSYIGSIEFLLQFHEIYHWDNTPLDEIPHSIKQPLDSVPTPLHAFQNALEIKS